MPEQQPAQPIYNNKRFKVSDYNFEMFIGLSCRGSGADYTLTDLKTGEDVKLSDLAENGWSSKPDPPPVPCTPKHP